jgi:hypothetical protein
VEGAVESVRNGVGAVLEVRLGGRTSGEAGR